MRGIKRLLRRRPLNEDSRQIIWIGEEGSAPCMLIPSTEGLYVFTWTFDLDLETDASYVLVGILTDAEAKAVSEASEDVGLLEHVRAEMANTSATILVDIRDGRDIRATDFTVPRQGSEGDFVDLMFEKAEGLRETPKAASVIPESVRQALAVRRVAVHA